MSESRKPMTPPQRHALEALVALADEPHGTAALPWGFASPRMVAQQMWPDSPGWQKVSRRYATTSGGAKGATMPMKAAQLLWRLRDLGYARKRTGAVLENTWEPTDRGRAALETDEGRPA